MASIEQVANGIASRVKDALFTAANQGRHLDEGCNGADIESIIDTHRLSANELQAQMADALGDKPNE